MIDNDRFVNPYTFVPLPKGRAKRSDCTIAAEPVFSGEIKCRLSAKTQIAVPDILKNPLPDEDKRTEPKEYDFFTLDGKAAIPGSGIRGVIRSVFEVLTDSCMHLNDKDDDYFHTRVNKEKPGIITYDPKENVYKLYEAERFRDKTETEHKTGDIVYFNSKPGEGKACDLIDFYRERRGDDDIPGVYLRVNTFNSKDRNGNPTKSNPSVFRAIDNGEAIDDAYIDCLKQNVKMYQGIHQEEYSNLIDEMKSKGRQLPVWYWQDTSTERKDYYLAPSQYSRAVFRNKPHDIVLNAKMQACTSQKECCAACALFGFIAGENGNSQSRASHVRFTDAICGQADCFDGSYLLPVLSTPRLSSFEFYLAGNEKNSLGPDSENVTIAGRKFYWHAPQNVITKDDDFAEEHPKMAARMQLVKKGSEFAFSVFYDRITEDQLKKLVFALNLGENYAGSVRCHKIGHGKPAGLGSVKIIVDRITRRSFENGAYSVNDITEDIVSAANTEMFRQTAEFKAFITKVVNLNYVAKRTVDYPRETAGGEIFKWFAHNRDGLRSTGYIKQINHLPRITDDDQTLPRNPKSNQKRRNNTDRGSGGRNSGSGYYNNTR